MTLCLFSPSWRCFKLNCPGIVVSIYSLSPRLLVHAPLSKQMPFRADCLSLSSVSLSRLRLPIQFLTSCILRRLDNLRRHHWWCRTQCTSKSSFYSIWPDWKETFQCGECLGINVGGISIPNCLGIVSMIYSVRRDIFVRWPFPSIKSHYSSFMGIWSNSSWDEMSMVEREDFLWRSFLLEGL